MSDVNANIGIHFDTSDALAQLRQLQSGLSRFNQALTEGNVAAANAQKGLNAQLVQSINATGKFVASQKNIASSTTAFTEALEKNKLSMGQYFRYTAAAATQNSKVFSNAFKQEKDTLNRAMKDRVKALQTQYIQLTNANGDLVKVLQVVPKHLKMVNGQYADYATRTQMAAQRQQFLNQLIKQGSTQLLNFGKNTQWAGRQLMVGFTVPLSMLGAVASKAFREMEQATLKFTRVYGDMLTSVTDTDKAVKEIQMLAKEFTKFGIAATETMTMAADAAAMGLTGAALQAQVINATKLAVLGQVEQQQALETTISLTNAFGIATEDLANKINFLNAVENQTVLSIEDLTIAVPKAGPVVKQLGGSVEDLAFFMTAMKEGGINASEGANALKSGLASMINPSKKASEFLGSLGINIKGLVEANKGDLKGTVVGFARALDTLDPLNRARAIEQLFGKFQFARLSTLFQNVTKDSSQAARALGLAGASVEELAILSERELGKVENAVGVKFQKQLENLKLQLMPIGKAFLEAVTPVVQFAGKILEKFNNLSDGTKKFVVGFIAIVGAVAPALLMTVGLVANGVANLIKFFGMLRGGMAKLNGQNNVLGGGFDYLTQAETDNLAQTEALHVSHQELISTFNVEKTSVDLLAQAYANAASQARALASGSPGLFNAAPGAKGAVSGLPKFADGKVPGNESEGDSVLALVAPGETIVPTALSKKYGPLLKAIMGDKLPGYIKGKRAITSDQESFVSQTASITSSQAGVADEMAKQLEFINKASAEKLIAYAKATGKTVADSSEKTLEELRKSLIADVEKIFTSVAETAKSKGKELTVSAVKSATKAKGTAGESSIHQFYNPRANQQQSTQFGHAETSNTYRADQLSQVAKITDAKAKAEADAIISAINSYNTKNNANVEMPKVTPVSGFGFEMTGEINKAMNDATLQLKDGTDTIDAFMKDFKERGIEKWRKSVEIGGGNFEELSSSLKVYDDKILESVQAWKTANPGKAFTDTEFMKIEQTVRSQVLTVSDGLGAVFEEARNTVTAVRLKLTKVQRDILNDDAVASGAVPAGTEKYASDRTTYQLGGTERRNSTGMGKFADEVSEDLSNAERIAETASPSKRTKRLGKDIADGLALGLEEGKAGVKTQSSRLASAAVPSAAETQAKLEKMDLTNKAFYDDLDTPELRDERQILKSQDRNRRKRGATGTVDTAFLGQNIIEEKAAGGTDIRVQISTEKSAADRLLLEAAKAEQVAARLRIEAARWEEAAIKEGNKGNTANENVEALKSQADAAELKAAQLRIQAAEEASAAAKSKKSGKTEDVVKSAKASAKEASKTRVAQEQVTDATQDVVKAQRDYAENAQNASDTARGTANTSLDVLDSEADIARNAEVTAQASQAHAQNTLTAAELTQATESTLQDSVDNNQQILAAEDDRARSAEEIAKLENDIEAQKRKEKEAGQAALAAQMAGPVIPPGSQTKNKTVNPLTAMGYEDAYNEAATYTRDKDGQILFDPELGPNGEKNPTTMSQKQITKKKRGMRREKVGKYSGKASGALGMATMAAGMMGAPPQVTAALGTASTVAQFAPMLAGMGPVGWAAAGIMAVGAGAYMLNQHFNKMAAESAKFVIATSATRDSMKKMGELTGKVGASEIMDRRRSTTQYSKYTGEYKVPDRFGKKFMGSDLGKDTKKTFKENLAKYGDRKATDDLAMKLAAQVADGVLTGDQAESIAQALALSLKNQKIQLQVTGKMRTLLGPNGEDLKDKPIETRLNLIANSRMRSQDALRTIQKKGDKGESQRKDIAALAAFNINNLELATMQADAVQLEYETQKKKLEVEIASTTNLQKKAKLQAELDGLNTKAIQNQQVMNNAIVNQIVRGQADFNKFYSDSDFGGQATREDAYFDASRATVEAAYKGTGQEKAAEKFLDTTKDFEENATTGTYNSKTGAYDKNGLGTARAAQGFQAKMEMLVGGKVISPDEANSWIKMFSGSLGKLNTMIDVGITAHGIGKTKELMGMFSGFGNKKLAQTMVQNIITKKGPEFDATMEALKNIQSLDGTTIDMEILLKGAGPEIAAELQRQQEALEKQKEEADAADKKSGKQSSGLDYLAKAEASNAPMASAIAALKKDDKKMAEFNKLSNAQRTQYLQKLAIGYAYEKKLNATQLAADKENWVYKQMMIGEDTRLLQEGTTAYTEAADKLKLAYDSMDAGTRAAANLDIAVVSGINSNGAGVDGSGDGSKERDTTYDDLLRRLRNVRLAALDAAKGIGELRKAIAATGDKAIKNQFNGLEQQLIKMGQSAQFTDYLAGLDTKDLAKFGKTATKKGTQKYTTVDPETGKKVTKTQKYKKGDFVLNQTGRDMEAGFNKAIIGDYNKAQLQSVTLAKQEIAARGKLLALGFDERDIQVMLADENYKTLIATGKVTKQELETNAALTKQQRIINQINGTVAGLKDKVQTSEDQKRIPEVVAMMQKAGMNAEGIREAISDPGMLSTLINGMDNFATLAKDAQDEFNHLLYQIDGIPERKIIELVFTQTTEQKKIAGANAAAEMFDAYKMIDENTLKNEQGNTFVGLQTKIEDLNNQAKIAQNSINMTQSKIDDMQKAVDKDQRDIETNFTRPIDAKQRAIEKLTRSADVNFTRPIQALQERSGILSHDLDVMNHAAEEINKKYDAQQKALEEVAKVNQQIIQQQQQQLGLADALSKGDINAAAKAVQDMRASNASNYAQNSQEALQKARENEVGKLRGGVSGKSQEDIQKEQWEISQQTYALEQQKALVDKQIFVIQEEIYALEQSRQVALDAIQVKTDAIAKIVNGTLLDQQNALKAITDQVLPLQQQSDLLAQTIATNDKNRIIQGKTRSEWDLTLKAAQAAEKLAKNELALALGNAATVSEGVKDSWDAIKKAYDGILSKSVEIKQYITTTYGPMPAGANVTDKPEDKKQEVKADPKADAMAALSGAKTNTEINNAVKAAQAAGVSASTIANGMIAPLIASGADAASAAVTARWTGQGLAFQQQEDARKAKEAQSLASAAALRKLTSGQALTADEKKILGMASGGLVPKYFAAGGYARGTDTVPAMLTPGEFIMSRYAVNTHGVDTLKAMNSGASAGDSVYNYNLSVNVRSDANPNDIARTVIAQIKQIDSQRIGGNRF